MLYACGVVFVVVVVLFKSNERTVNSWKGLILYILDSVSVSTMIAIIRDKIQYNFNALCKVLFHIVI